MTAATTGGSVDNNYEYLQDYGDQLQEGFEDPNAGYFEEAAVEFAEQAGTYTSEFSDPYFTSEYADVLFTSVDVYADAVDLNSYEETGMPPFSVPRLMRVRVG